MVYNLIGILIAINQSETERSPYSIGNSRNLINVCQLGNRSKDGKKQIQIDPIYLVRVRLSVKIEWNYICFYLIEINPWFPMIIIHELEPKPKITQKNIISNVSNGNCMWRHLITKFNTRSTFSRDIPIAIVELKHDWCATCQYIYV